MPDHAARAFSIRIFVPGGDPDGLRLVEKSNWTGVGVVFSRSNYKDVVTRPEFDRTGVYVLVGSSESSVLPIVYVGEGDPVKDRLAQHQQKKDFWEWAVFFVTKDNSLNKAHVQHLEARLHELAQRAKRCNLDNLQSPSPPTLSEPERADVESFLQDVLSIFPLLGVSVFEQADAPRQSNGSPVLQLAAKGITARGYEDPRGFIVCGGSEAVSDEVPSIHQYLTAMRRDLLATGVLVATGSALHFSQDHIFGSPSTAAGVILGRSSNGREVWKTADGRSLKDLQAAIA